MRRSQVQQWVWSGGAKVACILRHRGVQLILAYSWARPAVLVASKGRGGMFLFFYFFTFIPVPLSSLSLSFISSTISSISFLPFSGKRLKLTHKGWRVVKPQHNQSINQSQLQKTTHIFSFQRTQVLTFHVNRLLGRRFTWNVKTYFSL